jgi:hypothetical protein
MVYMDSPSPYDYPYVLPDTAGGFISRLTVGSRPTGAHQICADSGSAQPVVIKVCAPFTIEAFQPKISLTVASGGPGTMFTINESGFFPNGPIAQYIDVNNPDAGYPQPHFYGTPVPVDGQGRHVQLTMWPSSRAVSSPGVYNVCAEAGGRWAGPSDYPMKVCAQFEVTGAFVTTSSSPSPSPSRVVFVTLTAQHSDDPGASPLIAVLTEVAVLVAMTVLGVVRLFRRPGR